MPSFSFLFAQSSARTVYLIDPLRPIAEWWQWILLGALCVAAVAFIVWVYLRDSAELPKGTAVLLMTLRVAAFVGLLVFFLNPEKRTQQKLTKNSRAALLVDTSQSMALEDTGEGSAGDDSRISQVLDELTGGDLLNTLRQAHDVIVYRFDQTSQPVQVATLGKFPSGDEGAEFGAQRQTSAWVGASLLTGLAVVALIVCVVFAVVFLALLMRGSKREGASWALLVSVFSLICAVVIFGVAMLAFSERSLAASPAEENQTQGEDEIKAPEEIDWSKELEARGLESRLGDALQWIINKERGGAISAVAVFTDGGQNAGADVRLAVNAAQDAGIKVHAVGLGSNVRPSNVRLVDVEAPPRVYPGDAFTVTGYVQAYGYNRPPTVDVKLFSSSGENSQDEAFEEERRVGLPPEGDVEAVKFEVTPRGQGRRVYRIEVASPSQDHDVKDNVKTAAVQVVERKNRVLMFAGGPTREFRFLRNMLYRDRDTTLDVYLQTAQPGVSQEANTMLYEFPSTADEMFEYDCIIAFDPDWRALDSNQIELLDRWLAEQAGGMITVAGPVYTRLWSSSGGDKRLDTIKAIYPVVFYSEGSPQLRQGRFSADASWPLQFTREGEEAEFLWLGDSAFDSQRDWNSFGVYGYYSVKEPKPGTVIYAHFSDPDTSFGGELPIYLAGHFYGAGRVFFQASGEMWRMRSVDEAHFEQYYTKLIRWASQGRLLRDSSRGVLMVDKDRALKGDQVAVRTFLTDPRHEPLTEPSVQAVVSQPDGSREMLTLRMARDSAREGMYAGHFTVEQEGDYRVEVPIPNTEDDEVLSRDVRVRVPDLEIERPERNDALLRELASKTGGEYYVGMDSAVAKGGANRAKLTSQFVPQTQVTYLPGTEDRMFERRLMTLLLALVCGVLCLEWLVRRLSKLA